MALGSTMLQLLVEQQLAQEVSTVTPIFAWAAEFMSLGTVTVREIAVERMGGIAGDSSVIPVSVSTNGFATLRLVHDSPDAQEEVQFYAPSHVSSPPFANGLIAILELRDAGFTSGAANLQVARRVAAHAYLDEV